MRGSGNDAGSGKREAGSGSDRERFVGATFAGKKGQAGARS
jgi:hypothetical protein